MNAIQTLFANPSETERFFIDCIPALRDHPETLNSLIEGIGITIKDQPTLLENISMTKEDLAALLSRNAEKIEESFKTGYRQEEERDRDLDELDSRTNEHIENMMRFIDETSKSFEQISKIFDPMLQANDQLMEVIPPESRSELQEKIKEINGVEDIPPATDESSQTPRRMKKPRALV